MSMDNAASIVVERISKRTCRQNFIFPAVLENEDSFDQLVGGDRCIGRGTRISIDRNDGFPTTMHHFNRYHYNTPFYSFLGALAHEKHLAPKIARGVHGSGTQGVLIMTPLCQ